ncbi:Abscisic acid G-protein coupled receptor-like domain-containing protein [Sporodiniella umbellata]|nr:Abscisic acid G-protein coupled receptor-like domain-containing protein [Sporodiniella umbellata]
MKDDLEELERGRTRSIYAKTWKGKTWKWVNKGLAVYCVYRFTTTMIYITLGKQQGTSDPVTRALSIIISRFDSFDIDPGVWSQQLSFWFAGIIVFSSVRSFLKLVTKVLEMFMLQITFSTPSILTLTAQVMGMYFLSSALVIQMNLPPEYRYLLSSSIQAVEFDLFKYWSDAIAVVSCIISYCIIYVLHQTQSATTMAKDFTEIELLAAESGLA